MKCKHSGVQLAGATLAHFVQKLAGNAELALVQVARQDARHFVKLAVLTGNRSPAHIGYPPNECADVVACMGRKRRAPSAATQALFNGAPTLFIIKDPVLSLLQHAIHWTEVLRAQDCLQPEADHRSWGKYILAHIFSHC